MNVKSLYPIIVTDNPEETISFYEGLGFSRKHNMAAPAGPHVYVLNNGDMEIEIIENPKNGPMNFTPGLYGFRMNVNDIDEAFNELKEKGCTIVTPPIETAVGKNMMIRDDQGINITLIQHIKK